MPVLEDIWYTIAGKQAGTVPLLLMHGSGGNEKDLIPLAEKIAPAMPLISLRGGVEWEAGMPSSKEGQTEPSITVIWIIRRVVYADS